MAGAIMMGCPHCGGSVPVAAFCASCGKALPDRERSGPRIISGGNVPMGIVARQVLGHELHTLTHRAAYTLLVVGIVLLALGSVSWWAAEASPEPGRDDGTIAATILIAIGGMYLCLFSWAWKAPLAPSVIGLVLYCTMIASSILMNLAGAGDAKGFEGTGIGCLDVVIIAVLVQGIQGAVGQNRLRA